MTRPYSTFPSYQDSLTGLPNRKSFMDHLVQTLVTSHEEHRWVMFLDLDDFKNLNDDYGHDLDDDVLCQVATRLQDAIKGRDMVARFGGNEFMVLVEETLTGEQIRAYAARIHHMPTQPFASGNQTVQTGCSIGISMFPLHGNTPEALIKHADQAMYLAKANHEPYVLFDPGREGELFGILGSSFMVVL